MLSTTFSTDQRETDQTDTLRSFLLCLKSGKESSTAKAKFKTFKKAHPGRFQQVFYEA